MDNRISLITLAVKDVKKSAAFYQNVLGFKPSKYSMPVIAFFGLKGTWLALYGAKHLAQDAGVSAKGSGFRGVSVSHNLRSAKEVDKLFARLKRHRVKIVKPPQKAEWGGYSGYFADPDGHLWELAHNPFFWIGPK